MLLLVLVPDTYVRLVRTSYYTSYQVHVLRYLVYVRT